jgi:hypothetical protein
MSIDFVRTHSSVYATVSSFHLSGSWEAVVFDTVSSTNQVREIPKRCDRNLAFFSFLVALTVRCTISAFGDGPRRVLKVIRRFGKHRTYTKSHFVTVASNTMNRIFFHEDVSSPKPFTLLMTAQREREGQIVTNSHISRQR